MIRGCRQAGRASVHTAVKVHACVRREQRGRLDDPAGTSSPRQGERVRSGNSHELVWGPWGRSVNAWTPVLWRRVVKIGEDALRVMEAGPLGGPPVVKVEPVMGFESS